MRKVNNFQLALVSVGAIFGMVPIVISGLLPSQYRIYFIFGAILIASLVVFGAISFRQAINERSIWMRSPPKAIEWILFVLIPSVFIFFAVFIAYIIIFSNGSKNSILEFIVFIIMLMVTGKYLHHHLPNRMLLPYAIGSFGALLLTLLFLFLSE